MGTYEYAMFDSSAVKAAMKDKGFDTYTMADAIGRSQSFVSHSIIKGKMQKRAYDLMLKVLGLPEGSFIKKEEDPAEAKPEEKKGYTMSLEVKPDRVRVGVMFNGAECDSAWSWIKGNTELDFYQAISYATHILYKQAEQRTLKQ